MNRKLEEIYKIDKFIRTFEDERSLMYNHIRRVKRQIEKLEKPKWMEDCYSPFSGKEKDVIVYGRECKLILLKRIGSQKDWQGKYTIPINVQSYIAYLLVCNKFLCLGTYPERSTGSLNIEQKIIKLTPTYKKAQKYISNYSKKEIGKVVRHLEDKYKGYELENVISMNTNPEHWY